MSFLNLFLHKCKILHPSPNEANAKVVMSLHAAQGLQVTADLKDIDNLVRLSGRMECESPNRHLYEFVGNIRLDRHRWVCAQQCRTTSQQSW